MNDPPKPNDSFIRQLDVVSEWAECKTPQRQPEIQDENDPETKLNKQRKRDVRIIPSRTFLQLVRKPFSQLGNTKITKRVHLEYVQWENGCRHCHFIQSSALSHVGLGKLKHTFRLITPPTPRSLLYLLIINCRIVSLDFNYPVRSWRGVRVDDGGAEVP